MSKYTTQDFKPRDRVVYVPAHAIEDKNHEACRWGTVSSVNDFLVFVKFDEQLNKFGWEGTTSQGCHPTDLEK